MPETRDASTGQAMLCPEMTLAAAFMTELDHDQMTVRHYSNVAKCGCSPDSVARPRSSTFSPVSPYQAPRGLQLYHLDIRVLLHALSQRRAKRIFLLSQMAHHRKCGKSLKPERPDNRQWRTDISRAFSPGAAAADP